MLEILRKALMWGLEQAIFRGNRVGSPIGLLNAPSLIVQAAEGGQRADTIVYANVTKMSARLHQDLWNVSAWYANPCLPQLLPLTITIGDAGSHVPAVPPPRETRSQRKW